MCFNEVEEQYIGAVERVLNAERERVLAAQDQRDTTDALRERFDSHVEAVTREVELIAEAVVRSVGEDSPEGKAALGAANQMLQVEEAVANGVDRDEAFLRVVLLKEDPRTPVSDDPFEGVSLGGI